MKSPDSSKLKKIVLVCLVAVLGVLIGLMSEVIGDDFGNWLKSNDINPPTVYIVILICTIFTVILLAWDILSEKSETEEIKPITDNVETVIKELLGSLKERYQKRYESKLDGRFEITLEVTENLISKNTKQFKGEYEGTGQIREAFEYINSAFEKQGRLLIVGSPGVGKTVLLLNLALELLKKTDVGKKEAFPIIFNLASWSESYENFDDWLVSVLNSGEGLSKDLAGKLLNQNRIIFLLDGLDELARNEAEETAAEKRAECLQSLNNYLDRGKKAVICCRINEFEVMQSATGRDAPVSAKVKINDLSEAEVLNSLMKARENALDKAAAENLLALLEKDENDLFLKVLRTPFYFTTALEVFDKQNFEEEFPKDEKELEDYLRRKFFDKKLKTTSNPNNFDEEKTRKWLVVLAGLMENKHLITFELADLQPSDLTVKWKFGLVFRLVYGLVFGLHFGLLFGLLGGLVYGLLGGLFVSLVGGLFGNLFSCFFSGLILTYLNRSKKIQTEDIVILDFSKLFDWFLWKKILVGGWYGSLYLGLVSGLVYGLVYGLVGDLYGSLYLGVFVSLVGGLFYGLVIAFENIKSIKGFSRLENPYQRLKGGLLTNLYFSIFITLFNIIVTIFSIFYLQNQRNFFKIIFLFLPLFLLVLSVNTLIVKPFPLHLILRICLYLEDKTPFNYATFLDYAADLRILEKDGGFWRFRHQNLQEYFARLEIEE